MLSEPIHCATGVFETPSTHVYDACSGLLAKLLDADGFLFCISGLVFKSRVLGKPFPWTKDGANKSPFCTRSGACWCGLRCGTSKVTSSRKTPIRPCDPSISCFWHGHPGVHGVVFRLLFSPGKSFPQPGSPAPHQVHRHFGLFFCLAELV